jgi:tyrosinase
LSADAAHRPGPATQARALRRRKNAEHLLPPQLKALRDAFSSAEAIGDDRGFAHWAGIHGLPLPMYCQHGTRLFLPWHRAYLYFFELALRDLVPEAALVWWDWTSAGSHANGLPAAYAQANANGGPNPLYKTTVPPVARQNNQPHETSRAAGAPADLPTAADVEAVLSLPDFLDFQGQLEQIHNAVHVWVGGTMGEIPWAAYDPVFFAHHTMIDRLWRLWQLRHPNPHLPADLLTQALPPFPLTVEQTLDIKALGYAYVVTSSHAVAG